MTDEDRALHTLAEIRALQAQVSTRLDAVIDRLDRLDGAPTPSVRLAFIHIPKTGGGTLKGMIAAGGNKVVTSGNFFRGSETTTAKLSRKLAPGGRRQGDVAIGHVPYGTYRSFLPHGVRYFTFLREPVDRVLSHFYRHSFHRSGEQKPEYQGAVTIESAVAGENFPVFNNLQTRCLCSDPAPTGPLPDSALDEAKANLDTFAFVGIQERFLESLVLFQRSVDLALAPSRDWHVNADRPSLDELAEEERLLIEEHNQLDAELYRHARARFDAQVAEVDDDFRAEVEALRAASTEANERDRAQVEAAAEWLERELPPGAVVVDDALRKAGSETGLSENQLRRAVRLVKDQRRESEPAEATR